MILKGFVKNEAQGLINLSTMGLNGMLAASPLGLAANVNGLRFEAAQIPIAPDERYGAGMSQSVDFMSMVAGVGAIRLGGVGVANNVGSLGRVLPEAEIAGDFTPLKFQGDRTYALVPSIEGSGPLRWIRTDRIDPAPSVHGNSLSNPDPTHVYAIRDESGVLWKIGESAQGTNATGMSIRAEQQVRDLNLLYPDKFFKSEIRAWLPNKAEGRAYETQLIERYRSMYGQDKLPGNLTNR